MHRCFRVRRFPTNAVRTAKYTVLSFLPKSLMEQFRRVANVYFLVISILQLATDLSPTSPYSTVIPLTIVLTVSLVKEAIEDVKRHRADRVVNNATVTVLQSSSRAARLYRRRGLCARLWGCCSRGAPPMAAAAVQLPSVSGPHGLSATVLSSPDAAQPPSLTEHNGPTSAYVGLASSAAGMTTVGGSVHYATGANAAAPVGTLPVATVNALSATTSPRAGTAATTMNTACVAMAPDPSAEWRGVRWKALQAGDIVLLEKGDPAPADLVVLAAAPPPGSLDHTTGSLAYVETSILDGA